MKIEKIIGSHESDRVYARAKKLGLKTCYIFGRTRRDLLVALPDGANDRLMKFNRKGKYE